MKISSIFLICLLLTALTTNPAKAQNIKQPLFSPLPSKTTASELLSRALVICKREIDPKEAEKLKKKKPEQLAFEENYNEYFNDAMLQYFTQMFAGSKKIELKSRAEVDALISSASKEVAVISSSDLSRSFEVSSSTKSQDTYTFKMFLPENKKEVFMISFLNDIFSDADFIFLVQQVNLNLQKIIAGETLPSYSYTNENNAKKLKTLKLIVNLQKLETGITKEEITAKYTYPIEFVDSLGAYEDIIKEQKSGYAYITSIWSPTLYGAGYVAVDAATGEILSILSAGGVHFAIGWRPQQTGNPVYDRYNNKMYAFDIIKFKVKYELKPGHFKYFNKLASE